MAEVVGRRVAVDLDCRTAVRKHSNTVKQWEHVRAALCEAISQGQLMAAKQRIRRPLALAPVEGCSSQIRVMTPGFFCCTSRAGGQARPV